jgi:hypothetical protein
VSAVALGGEAACAHGIVGNRFFPATLAIDDPAAADELALPTVAVFQNADGSHETDVSGEYSKRIFEDLSVSVGPSWSRITGAGEPAVQGWNNLDTTLKWQFLTDPKRELIVSAGVEAEWGGSGSASLGGDKITTVQPTLFFGRGFGDARADWFKPFAITGVLGYSIPTRGHLSVTRADPKTGLPVTDIEQGQHTVQWGFALEYSLPYLTSHVRDHGWPMWVNRLTPLVEASFQSPVGGQGGFTTGNFYPGVIWSGRKVQLGLEAIVPANRQSGRGVGAQAQFHIYLDDMFPHTIGRPLFQRRAS